MNEQLTKKERREQRKLDQMGEQKKLMRKSKFKKIGITATWVLGISLAVFGLSSVLGSAKSLPPTDMANHIEQSPESHIIREPMQLAVHKHMLEHSDGEGPPGVIINYDCENYTCEEGFVDTLEEMGRGYPDFVYVAPFKNMEERLVITKLGEQEIINGLNEEAIINFIEGR